MVFFSDDSRCSCPGSRGSQLTCFPSRLSSYFPARPACKLQHAQHRVTRVRLGRPGKIDRCVVTLVRVSDRQKTVGHSFCKEEDTGWEVQARYDRAGRHDSRSSFPELAGSGAALAGLASLLEPPPWDSPTPSPSGAPPSSRWRDMAGRPSPGSCTTRRPGPSWAARPSPGPSSPSSTSSTTPFWPASGRSCSSSSSSSSRWTNPSGSRTTASSV